MNKTTSFEKKLANTNLNISEDCVLLLWTMLKQYNGQGRVNALTSYLFVSIPSISNLSKLFLSLYILLNKQIFHVFLFNIRNSSPEVIDIQRRDAKLNVILPKEKSFDIKKDMEHLFYYMPIESIEFEFS